MSSPIWINRNDSNVGKMQVRAGEDEKALVHKKDVKFAAWAYCSFKIQDKIRDKIKLMRFWHIISVQAT